MGARKTRPLCLIGTDTNTPNKIINPEHRQIFRQPDGYTIDHPRL